MTDERPAPYFRLTGEAPDADDYGPAMGSRDALPLYEMAAGVSFQPVYGRNLLLNFVSFAPGCGFPAHQHPEEQMGFVVEGEMEFTLAGETRLLRRGDVYVAPPNVLHSGRTGELGCTMLDIFSPPRSGFRELIEQAIARPDSPAWTELGREPLITDGTHRTR